MSKFKKLAAVMLSVVMFVCAFGVQASAADIKTIKSGTQYNVTLKKNEDTESYKFVVKEDGELKLSIVSKISKISVKLINEYDKEFFPEKSLSKTTLGEWGKPYLGDGVSVAWNSAEKYFKGTLGYKLKKGTYYLQITNNDMWSKNGTKVSFKATFPSDSSSSSSSGDVKITYITVPMNVGDMHILSATLSGDTDDKVTWKSSKSSVVSVSSSGLVTAKAEGVAIITATLGNSTSKLRIKVSG